MKDEKWYWPIRLLKSLARLPINCDSWLGHGHTVENREPFADNTKLCTATLISPQDTEDGSEVCTLPGARRSTSIRSFRFMRTSWTINWNMM